MQKTSLILALALAFTPVVRAENVTINGTGVSIEANKTPINPSKTVMRWRSYRRIIALPCPGNLPWR